MTYDTLERRCPRLGHPVPFRFCRTSEQEQPCFKALDCWWEQFDVVAYFKARLSAADFERLTHRPTPDKVVSLLDLIRQAKERVSQR